MSKSNFIVYSDAVASAIRASISHLFILGYNYLDPDSIYVNE